MGTMTGAQLESDVRYNLGGRTDLDSRLYLFLNWAQERAVRHHSFRELEMLGTSTSTVASTDYIAAPTGLRAMVSIRVLDGTSSRKLTFVPERTFDALIAKPDVYTTGCPTHYYIWGSNIYLWRIPDAIYSTRIRYLKWPTAFTASSSSTSDLNQKDEMLIAFATAAAKRSRREFEDMAFWMAEGDKLLAAAIEQDRRLHPDFEISSDTVGETNIKADYWLDPFMRSNP